MVLLPTTHRDATQLHPFSSQGETSCLLSSQLQLFLSSLLALVAQVPRDLLRVSNTLEAT